MFIILIAQSLIGLPLVKAPVKMSSKKGLSFEEKRKRMIEFFYEKKDYFQLKELEKVLPKAKGIVAQSVKEVLQSLVDDRMVQGEKIGTSNYFWSFPSTALQIRKNQLEVMQAELSKLQTMQSDLTEQIEKASTGRQETDDRLILIKRLAEAESQHRSHTAELSQFKEFDPDLFEARRAEVARLREAVNRWTDNLFSLQSYCGGQFNIGRADFNAQFGVPEDLDYVE